ncbi:MAG: hypothetical protein MOB07_31495 [Acidobacteria bacterium]|nr:hypothetical protein [Acidobacteriota bacterium]
MTKGITWFLEINHPVQIKPGYFKGTFKDGYFKRAWWLWFAIGWVRLNLNEYNEWIATGNTEWRMK